MKKVWLILLGAAVCLSTPASASLQADGAALLSQFNATVKANPVLSKALKQIKNGAASTAIPKLISYLRSDPQNSEAWYLLSLAFVETDQQELSDEAGAYAVGLKPQLNELTRYLTAQLAASTAAPMSQESGNSSATAQNTPAASTGSFRSPVLGVYQCYFATYTRWTASDYGDAPIAKLTLSPGNRFTYANSGGTYAVGGNNELTFNGLKASYYTGARLVQDGTSTAIQLQFGQYGVQNCVTK